MKKIIKTFLAILIVAAAIIAVYRFGFRKSIPETADATEQVQAILTQNDCFVCHSAEPMLPFYSKLPVIGKMLDKHVTNAVNYVNLEKEDLSDISEVGLSMLDYTLHQGNMPIFEYKMIHWGTGFNKKEKSVLASWIEAQRAAKFSDGLAAQEFANEPVRPVPSSIPTCPAKVELGKAMYNEGRISADGTISCASCHILEDNGADEDNDRTSEGIFGQFGGVNAPSVYNAYFNIQQFWNGRAADLQEQAAGPPVNPVEMGDQTWDDIVARLREDKTLVARFQEIYPSEGLTQASVTDAIAEFEKTLLTPDSPFDLYLKGDKSAITQEEIAGYEAFKNNACATCHTGVILGGQSFERLGIFADYFADRSTDIAYNSDDDGLKGFTGNDADLHKFKVPGLRNVALTAPYFHDGSMATLEDAVRAMAKYELGYELAESDVNSIVAFMKALNGKHEYLSK